MRIAAVVILCVVDLPSPGYADCYGLHEPSALEQRGAYARDCETIRSLISCGLQQRDAIAIVVDRHAMEGYMEQLVAQCTTARAKTTVAPEQPPPWLAEMNKTRNSRRAPRTVCSIATTSSRGSRSRGRRTTCATVWRGMVRRSGGRYEPGSRRRMWTPRPASSTARCLSRSGACQKKGRHAPPVHPATPRRQPVDDDG